MRFQRTADVFSKVDEGSSVFVGPYGGAGSHANVEVLSSTNAGL